MNTPLKIARKVGIKHSLNFFLPGLGSIVEFLESFTEICKGNYINAAISASCGLFDLYTLGIFGTAKEIAKTSAKKAAIVAAKDQAKLCCKLLGKQAAKNIAKGANKRATIEMAILMSDFIKKEVGDSFARQLASGMIGQTVEEAFRRGSLQLALKGACMGVIGSGGKNVLDEIIEGMLTGWLNGISSSAKDVIFKTATSEAAAIAAKDVAVAYFKEELIKEIIFNAGKGIAKNIE